MFFKRKQRGRKPRPVVEVNDPDLFFYGDGKTIHGTTYVDVETFEGRVVSIWFRCSTIPFKQHEVDRGRAADMQKYPAESELHGLVVKR